MPRVTGRQRSSFRLCKRWTGIWSGRWPTVFVNLNLILLEWMHEWSIQWIQLDRVQCRVVLCSVSRWGTDTILLLLLFGLFPPTNHTGRPENRWIASGRHGWICRAGHGGSVRQCGESEKGDIEHWWCLRQFSEFLARPWNIPARRAGSLRECQHSAAEPGRRIQAMAVLISTLWLFWLCRCDDRWGNMSWIYYKHNEIFDYCYRFLQSEDTREIYYVTILSLLSKKQILKAHKEWL